MTAAHHGSLSSIAFLINANANVDYQSPKVIREHNIASVVWYIITQG
jgi:hypothetical protein